MYEIYFHFWPNDRLRLGAASAANAVVAVRRHARTRASHYTAMVYGVHGERIKIQQQSRMPSILTLPQWRCVNLSASQRYAVSRIC